MREYTKKIMRVWRDRRNPECAHAIFSWVWYSALSFILFTIVLSAAAALFLSKNVSQKDDGPVVSSGLETLKREDLANTLDGIEQRQMRLENLKVNPPRVADPS